MLRVATGSIDELVTGRFQEVIDDPKFAGGASAKDVKRVVLCSGKVYFELADRRDKIGRGDIAIVRVEQFYPLHAAALKDIINRYPKNAELVWCQEEPRNAGGYLYMDDCVRNQLGIAKLGYIGREASATPAVGSKHAHKDQQEAVIAKAIGPLSEIKGEKKEPAKGGAKRREEKTAEH